MTPADEIGVIESGHGAAWRFDPIAFSRRPLAAWPPSGTSRRCADRSRPVKRIRGLGRVDRFINLGRFDFPPSRKPWPT